jgi:dTDP-4-dehydrorhamnose 3,5-epimerase
VLRGLHFQQHEHAQAKLVRVLQGSVLDVVVDIRKGSATYGQTFSIELTESNHKQLFVPRGFAHGFLVTSETAVFFYKVDNYYNKASEQGIMYNDPQLAIDWGMDAAEFLLSEKDQQLPYLQAVEPQEV